MLTSICCIIVLLIELIIIPKKIKTYKKSHAQLDLIGLWCDIVVIICMVLLLIEEIFF